MAFLNLLGSTAAKLSSQLRMIDITLSDDFAYKPFRPKVEGSASMTYTYIVDQAAFFYRGEFVHYYFNVKGTTGGVASYLLQIDLPVPAFDCYQTGTVRYQNGATRPIGPATLNDTSPDLLYLEQYDSANFALGQLDFCGSITYRAARKR